MTQAAAQAGDIWLPHPHSEHPWPPLGGGLKGLELPTRPHCPLFAPQAGGRQASWSCHHSGEGPELGRLVGGRGVLSVPKAPPRPLGPLQGVFPPLGG